MNIIGNATLTDCTISGNSAPEGGGLNNEFGYSTITGCTISGNSANEGGGLDGGEDLTIGDTIVAGNTAATGPDVDGAIATDHGYNLIGNTAGSSGFTAPTDQLNQAAALAPLGDYGGPTQTMALLPGSPAIGKGAALGQTTDQRGFPLDSPTPDIGAFQTQSAGPLVVTETGDSAAPAGELDLRTAVNLANVLGAAEMITFDPTAFATPQTITLTRGQLELKDTGGAQTITGPAAGLTISGGGHSGVFQVDSGVTASLSGLTITGGVANQGGGLDNYGTAMLTDCTISGNSANGGGGLDNNRHAVMTLTGCTISGNSAETGGGVNIESPDPSLFADNTATFTDCTISGNSAEAGGGVYLAFGTATFTDCTISSNSVSLFGGGLNSIGAATLTDCTLSGNSASLLGGGLNSEFGTVTIGDTIVAGNTAATEPDVDGAISTDQGYNLIGNTAGSSGLTASTDRLNRAAALAPLGDYGGPTQTMALLPGSPAIAKGAALGQTTDQRGFPLDSPTPDIGAFQTQSAGPLVVTETGDSGAPAGELDLRGAVNLANVLGAAETITFDPSAFAQAQTITLTRGQLELKDTGGAQTITGPAAGLTISGGGHSGVFQVDSGVTASLSGLTITGGVANQGGGLDNYGTAMLTDCTISGNSANGGGGLDNNRHAVMTLTGCTISGNSAETGGGVNIESPDPSLFADNTATFTDCTISGNSAEAGGGVYLAFGTATFTDCTISSNSVSLFGGGLNSIGAATLTDCTLSGNSASLLGGGLNSEFGTVTIGDTIVAGNTAATEPDVDGAISTDQGYNLIGNTAGSSGLTASTDRLNRAAALAPLGDYGGPTQTMALLPGSPAIAKGAALGQTTDQRGFPLDSPTPDIGAFQTQSAGPLVVTETGDSGAPPESSTCAERSTWPTSWAPPRRSPSTRPPSPRRRRSP